jgi:quercetin dioxygenase-like cupin family protein
METETIKIKAPISNTKSQSLLKGSLRAFDLPALIERMKQSRKWANGELNAMVLLKSRYRQIVLTALHDETEIISFQSNDSITLHIIEGKLRFQTGKESVTLYKGHFLTLHEKIKYSLTTGKETIFLITIANSALKPLIN